MVPGFEENNAPKEEWRKIENAEKSHLIPRTLHNEMINKGTRVGGVTKRLTNLQIKEAEGSEPYFGVDYKVVLKKCI